MELGQRVVSAAVIAPDDDLPPAAAPDAWRGQPGTRVPHVWIMQAGRRVSTVDLFTRGLSLVSQDVRWIRAAEAVGKATGAPITTVQVGRDVLFPADAAFEAVFNLSPDGACLVRPDAIAAWRAKGWIANPDGALLKVVERIVAAAD